MNHLADLLYLAGAILFIVGLKMLAKTAVARRGNAVSAIGMGCAIAGALVDLLASSQGGLAANAVPILTGLLIGTAVGVPLALMVKMTSMPEMVGLLNGFGGLASLLVGWGELHHHLKEANVAESVAAAAGHGVGAFTAVTIFLAALIGGLTFTGSIIAFLKLSERMPGKPIQFAGQQIVNGLLVLGVVAAMAAFAYDPTSYWMFLAVVGASLVLGVLAVIPIGGSDMPVVISLLNSYSGLAACAAGFAVNSLLLIVTGALVGASGVILTKIMCKAMNRSLANVLFSGFGSGSGSAASAGVQGTAKPMSTQDAYHVLEAARSVVVIPGYGMAVAQAQHAVRELGELLAANGADVRYAIHPVAGRMPGHMNVLLAEANVPYEQLVEMTDINPQMDTVDVALVIGANDTVNPAAIEDPNSPIAGMPIIEAFRAKTVFVLKRSMRSGFAGVDNPLFFRDNTWMIFGDAKATIEGLVAELKSVAAA